VPSTEDAYNGIKAELVYLAHLAVTFQNEDVGDLSELAQQV